MLTSNPLPAEETGAAWRGVAGRGVESRGEKVRAVQSIEKPLRLGHAPRSWSPLCVAAGISSERGESVHGSSGGSTDHMSVCGCVCTPVCPTESGLLTVGMSQCICARVICSHGFMCVLMGLCGFLYVRIWVSLYWRCRDEEGAFEDSLVVYTLMHVVCTCARRLLPGEDGCGIRARVLVYACVSREETPSSAKFPSPFRPKMKL